MIISNDYKWLSNAKCKGLTHIFYAAYSERPQARALREHKAKEICKTCSVIEECKALGRANCELGVWGGESEEDRYKLGFINVSDMSLKRKMNRIYAAK